MSRKKCKLVDGGSKVSVCEEMHRAMQIEGRPCDYYLLRSPRQSWDYTHREHLCETRYPTVKTLFGMTMFYCPFCGEKIYEDKGWTPSKSYSEGDVVYRDGERFVLEKVLFVLRSLVVA